MKENDLDGPHRHWTEEDWKVAKKKSQIFDESFLIKVFLTLLMA